MGSAASPTELKNNRIAIMANTAGNKTKNFLVFIISSFINALHSSF
jgi:hypothetical protein